MVIKKLLKTGVIMKSNKVTIISSLFLMTALCGCTTQSVDKAKEIEESNTYVYKYEYETNLYVWIIWIYI